MLKLQIQTRHYGHLKKIKDKFIKHRAQISKKCEAYLSQHSIQNARLTQASIQFKTRGSVQASVQFKTQGLAKPAFHFKHETRPCSRFYENARLKPAFQVTEQCYISAVTAPLLGQLIPT